MVGVVFVYQYIFFSCDGSMVIHGSLRIKETFIKNMNKLKRNITPALYSDFFPQIHVFLFCFANHDKIFLNTVKYIKSNHRFKVCRPKGGTRQLKPTV